MCVLNCKTWRLRPIKFEQDISDQVEDDMITFDLLQKIPSWQQFSLSNDLQTKLIAGTGLIFSHPRFRSCDDHTAAKIKH